MISMNWSIAFLKSAHLIANNTAHARKFYSLIMCCVKNFLLYLDFCKVHPHTHICASTTPSIPPALAPPHPGHPTSTRAAPSNPPAVVPPQASQWSWCHLTPKHPTGTSATLSIPPALASPCPRTSHWHYCCP